MEVVTVHAKPPKKLLKKRKRLLNTSLSTDPFKRDEDENGFGIRSTKRRKLKAEETTVNNLPWKALTRPKSSNFDSDVALMSLEEVDGVDIVYLDETKKRVSYNIQDNTKSRGQASQTYTSTDRPHSPVSGVPSDPPGFHNFNTKKLLPEWETLQLKGCLNRAIHKLGFQDPTEIQMQAIPTVLSGRDVVGVAETGSGKTLAFGLPILNHILSNPPQPNPRPLVALILTPTRELAMQVADHLNAVGSNLYPKSQEKEQAKLKRGQPKPPPRISVGAIVGGIDDHKQMRVIKRGMDIMVATPGRLWDLIGEDEDLAQSIRQVRFLVLDEADRMIETGHFKELEQIVKLTFREREGDRTTDPEFPTEAAESSAGSEAMQTLVFSATLSKDLQHNLKRRKQRSSKGKGAQKASSTLDDLLMRLDFRDPEPAVVDLSPDKGVVSTLQESKVECTIQDKDVYLYYFLLRYPGKTLVFLGSIDGIRRLQPIIQHLGVQAFILHSKMEQKQRLRSLERFRSTANSVLIATDIAARGLDIPSVEHVIHYQVPRSADVYVHRSGRTARAKQSGFSLLLVGPDERKTIRLLLQSLGREDDIPDLQLDLDIIDKLKHRVSLARRIDAVEHKHTKADHEKNWLKQAAKDLDVEIDPDFVHIEDEDGDEGAHRKKKREKQDTAGLKRELEFLLKQPLIANGVRAKYITSGTRSVVDNLIAGKAHETIVGVNKAAAIEGVAGHKNPSAHLAKAFTPTTPEVAWQSMHPGWNLGNTLDGIPTEGDWGNPPVTADVFTKIKAQGYKSVRIPVTWTHHFLAGNNTVDPTWMNRVEAVVDMALAQGFWVIVNVHHDSWEWFDMSSPTTEKEQKFEDLWTQIAAKLSLKAGTSERLIFEALNEPAGGGTKANADAYNFADLQFQNIVRNSGGYNKNRITSLEPLNGNSDYGNSWFYKIPAGWGDKWSYQFHFYSPYDFLWNAWGKTSWGTDADKAAVWQQMADVANNFTGIPTCIGEFGSTDSGHTNESASVWLWFDYVIRTARHFGFVTFMWDNGSFFDRTAGAWRDTTLGQVMKYAHLGIVNTLAEPGNSTVWLRQGDLIVDKTIGLRFSGNTLAGVYNGAGQALTSGTQYTASSTGVTLKASYVSSLLMPGKPLGSIGTIVIKSNQGADLKIDIRFYKTPTVATSSYQSPSTSSTLSIPVTLNGAKLATAKAIKADGSILKDDWTIYLPDSQAGRLTWGDFDYNESNTLTLSSTVIGLIQSAKQAVTVTFEFWPRYDPLNTVPITVSFV